MPTENNPAVIYLGPACEAETGDGRTWAEDWPWPDCECGHQPVQYVLGETFNRVKAEREALQQRLTAADERADVLEAWCRKIMNSSETMLSTAHEEELFGLVEPADANGYGQDDQPADVFVEPLKSCDVCGDEHICQGCGAKGWTANCKECVPY